LVGQQNYTFIPFSNQEANKNYLRYFVNPGDKPSAVLPLLYGSDVSAWYWLNSHVKPGQKIATFETRVYYMDFSLRSPNSIFYLDSSHAAPLYDLYSSIAVLNFMHDKSIHFVLVCIQDWTSSLFQALPFTNDLGSPLFPLLFADGLTQIFGVGPIRCPIIDSSLPAYTYGFSNTSIIDGVTTQNVTVNDDKPRLYIETDNRLVYAEIKYLDSGNGSLALNVFNPTNNGWLLGYATILKRNSNQWLDYGFLVPTNLANEYTTFGLHASGTNFTIAKIKINYVSIKNRSSYEFAGSVQISNLTTPKSAMIHLPLLTQGDTILAFANTQAYNCSVEVFAGYVPLNQTTGWWFSQQNVARYPPLSVAYGTRSPSLQWRVAQTNAYTLIIVWWDTTPRTNISVDVSITLTST
jgi:hypothetical protein